MQSVYSNLRISQARRGLEPAILACRHSPPRTHDGLGALSNKAVLPTKPAQMRDVFTSAVPSWKLKERASRETAKTFGGRGGQPSSIR